MKRLTAALGGTLLLGLSACGGTPQGGVSTCLAGFSTEISGDEASISSSQQLAQPFVLSTNASPSSLQIRLKGVGVLSGTITMTIESSNGSAQPDNTPLATATLTASSVSTGAEDWYTFTFTAAPSLLANTVYWIHVRNTALTGGNQVLWMGNNTDAYAGGSALTSTDGINWTTGVGTNRDLLFLIGC